MVNLKIILSIFIFFIFSNCTPSNKAYEKGTEVYISTFTVQKNEGYGPDDAIYHLRLDKSGALHLIDSITGVNDPSYITLHPSENLLFVAERPATKGQTGKLTSYRIGKNGAKRLNSVSAEGPNPCYVSVSTDGRYVLLANYNETIASFALQEDGTLSEAISVHQHQRAVPAIPRQEMAHPHMIHPLKDNIVLVTDLGLDSLFQYSLSDDGELKLITRIATIPKAGPRHFVNHPDSAWCYVVNELNRTIEVYDVTNPLKPLKRTQIISVLNQDDERVTAAAIRVHPSGRFLYTSNRGLQGSTVNSISVFQIDSLSGQLTLIDETATQGRIPRDFNISPDGQFLLAANRKTNAVVIFRIDPDSGKLTDTGQVIELPEPVCVVFR